MKKTIFSLILMFFASQIFAQSTTLTPGKVDTKNGTDHLTLKGTSTPTLTSIRQSGTLSSPTNTTVDDYLLSIEAAGWVNGAATNFQGALRFITTQNWTNANRGNKLDIYTTATNSNTAYRRFTINHDGKVGIGNYIITEPDHQLEVQQPSDSDRGVGVYRYGGDAPSIFGIGANGVTAIPLPTISGNILARFGAKGHDGTGYTNAKARIDMLANQNWTSTITGTDMRFYTTLGGTNLATEKMVIQGNGNVGIGVPDPTSTLTISGDLAVGSKVEILSGVSTEILERDNKSIIILDGSSSRFFKGITGGVDGVILHIYVRESLTSVEIYNEATNVLARNRIRTGEPNLAPNLTINGEGGCTLIYDGVFERWRIIGVQK